MIAPKRAALKASGAGTKTARRPAPEPPIAFELRGLRLDNPLNGSMGVTMAGRFARNAKRKTQRAAARWNMIAALRGRRADAYGCSLDRPLVVTITRIAPRALDDDNLAASAKSVRDGIADALAIDDGSPMLSWRYAQARGQAKEYGVHVRVELGNRGAAASRRTTR